MHRLALTVKEGISLEIAEQGSPPAQPRRVRSALLSKEEKYSS